MRPSEEADERQLALAREQGEAYGRALEAMDEESSSGVLARAAGEYEVAIAVEEAEGMYHLEDGELVWRNPGEENAHVEVAVRDAADGRFVPRLEVEVALYDPDGAHLGRHRQPFVWHPWLYHYGRNWTVPRKGRYRVHVHIDPPAFHRHDHENGRRYAKDVDVDFEVEIEPGRKTA